MSFSLAHMHCYEEEVKKSRFQALALPVENEQHIKELLQEHKDPSTTHQCWAWKIGHQVRFNDDGEPSGTAGRPILACIEGNDLSHVFVLVNRWYGGVKLGTGGLVRAYGGCAGKCLLDAEKIPLIEKKQATFSCQFSEWAILQYTLGQENIEFQESYQTDGVMVCAKLQVHQIADLNHTLQELTRGREQLKIQDQQHD